MKPYTIGRTSPASTSAARRAGFSLAEIMVVVLIIGLLVGYVGPRMFSNVDRAKVTNAERQMQTLQNAVESYRMDRNEWPDELEQLTEKDDRGNNYMDKIPQDPWNGEYALEIDGSDVIIWCYGSDNQPGGTETAMDLRWPEEESN